MFEIAVCVVSVAIATLLFYKRIYSFKGLDKFPSPLLYPIFGHVFEIRKCIHISEFLKVIQEKQEKFGKYCLIWTIKLQPYLLTTDVNLVEFLLSSTKHITKGLEYSMLKPWLGDGLLLSTGNKWHRRRKILTPSFHFKILEKFTGVFDKKGNILVDKLQSKIDQEIDIFPLINLYSLDVLCETAMGTNINAQTKENLPYVKSTRRLLHMLADRFFSPWKQFETLYKLSSGPQQERKEIDILHKLSLSVIEKRRRELLEKEDKQENCTKRGAMALLDLLLQATEDGNFLCNEAIREEVDTFMFAGHDTVSSALSFAIYLIAKHQDIQQKLYEELSEVFEKNGGESELNISDLQKLNYMELVIKESLRLYPPVPLMQRLLEEDVTLILATEVTKSVDMFFPKGLTIMVNTYAIHRAEEYFPEPEEFIPERFLKQNLLDKSPFIYIPFSAGPRNCIGQKFAMLEMKATIAKLLKNFVIQPVKNQKIKLYSDGIMKSYNGLPVIVQPRIST